MLVVALGGQKKKLDSKGGNSEQGFLHEVATQLWVTLETLLTTLQVTRLNGILLDQIIHCTNPVLHPLFFISYKDHDCMSLYICKE